VTPRPREAECVGSTNAKRADGRCQALVDGTKPPLSYPARRSGSAKMRRARRRRNRVPASGVITLSDHVNGASAPNRGAPIVNRDAREGGGGGRRAGRSIITS